MTAPKLTDEQLKIFINAAFHKYDKNQDGYLDFSQITLVMAQTFALIGVPRGVTDDQVRTFFKSSDINQDQKISPTELFIVFQKVLGQQALKAQ